MASVLAAGAGEAFDETSSTLLGANSLAASAATAFLTSNLSGSTVTVAVNAAALISTSVTPCNARSSAETVLRQPPQVMPGQVNFTTVAVASGNCRSDWLVASPVESGSAAPSGFEQPTANTSSKQGRYFNIGFL